MTCLENDEGGGEGEQQDADDDEVAGQVRGEAAHGEGERREPRGEGEHLARETGGERGARGVRVHGEVNAISDMRTTLFPQVKGNYE